MKIRQLPYLFVEGIKNVWSNGVLSLTAALIIFIMLSILGMFVILGVNIAQNIESIKRECEIQIFIDSNYREDITVIEKTIKSIAGISRVEFYSKEDILAEMKTVLKPELLEGFDNYNTFRDSYKIYLKDISLTKDVSRKLQNITGIANIKTAQQTVDSLAKASNTINLIGVFIIGILILASFFMVSNSIKMAFHSRKKEISIMKYVGATNCFIEFPFIIEGIVIGFLGASLAYGLVLISYNYFVDFIKKSFSLFHMLDFTAFLYILAVIFGTIGIVIGAASSAVSVRQHLKA